MMNDVSIMPFFGKDREMANALLSDDYNISLFHDNESVRTLLMLFNDKKSGKVGYSFKEIRRRFDFLSHTEQIKILICMLSDSKAYRIWAYKKCVRFRDKSLQQPILDTWGKNHDEECKTVLAQLMPTDILRKYMADLSEGVSYRYLCDRLGKEEWFTIDKQRLQKYTTILEYARLMTRSREPLSDDEMEELVFKYIAICVYWTRKHVEVLKGLRKEEYPNMVFYCNNHPMVIGRLSTLMVYIWHLNMDELHQRLIYWDMKVYRQCMSGMEMAATYCQPQDDRTTIELDIIIESIITNLPDKYCHLLDCSLDPYELNISYDGEPLTYVKRMKYPVEVCYYTKDDNTLDENKDIPY